MDSYLTFSAEILMLLNFIWANRARVKKRDVQETWDKGGMDFPDVRTSWKAFKMSWIRRLMYAKGTWVEVFKQQMKPKFIFNNPQKALLNLDMIYLSKKLKFIKSDFWKECFRDLPDLMTCYQIKKKAVIPYTNIWGNQVIKSIDGDPLNQSEFQNNVTNIQYLCDLIKPGVNNDGMEKTIHDLTSEFGITMHEAEIMQEVLRMNLQALGLDIRDIANYLLGRA